MVLFSRSYGNSNRPFRFLFFLAEPPRITNFLQYNLDYPKAVVAGHSDRGFELPCKAAGTKPLKWTWKIGQGRRSKKLAIDGTKFVLLDNGTLIGRSLTEKDINFYQCEVSNKQGTVFSRRIRVKVSGELDWQKDKQTDRQISMRTEKQRYRRTDR